MTQATIKLNSSTIHMDISVLKDENCYQMLLCLKTKLFWYNQPWTSVVCLSHIATVFTSQVFAYDYCFWSMDETDKEKFAG